MLAMTVTEIPLRLEPVTPDPFIRGLPTSPPPEPQRPGQPR
jgi:hypothetical protein